jgi:multidrug efflux pump subunit AcrA (membrane-fusion protein)
MSSRNRTFYLAVIISLSIAGATVFSACGRAKSAATNAAEAAEIKPVEVTTAQAQSREVPLFLQVTGNFAADELSDIAPQAPGQVVATPVDVGSFVRQGAVIARLDDRDAKLRLQQSLAAQRQAEAALKQAEAKIGLDAGGNFNATAVPEVIAARQNYEAAEAQAKLAESNARRYENLVKTGDVAQSVADQYRTQADTARAQANAAKQQYEVALNVARQNNQGIATAQAALDTARAQAAIARKAVSDTVITAPFAGYISDRPTAVGEYVTTQSKIATLIKSDTLKLNLQLPESSAALARPGISVIATVAAFPKAEFEGTISAVNPALDTASRTVIAEALIRNDGNRLKPGMFASAKIYQQGGGQGLFIPRSAVLTEANISSARVYVLEGDVARVRVVQVGEQEGDMIRVLNGIAAGDTVVTDNLEQLYDGAKIIKK